MNVHHLELYYYVAKYEGITAAVRKMPFGIQQPAVSGQLLQLENNLGVKLFNRRPFSLTPAGEILYDHIYPFFSDLKNIESTLKGDESKHLRIAASSAVLLNHIPQVLAELQNRISGLKLTLKEIEPSDAHSAIVGQQSDIAICPLNDQVSDSVTSEQLLTLDMVLYVPEDWDIEIFEHLLEENDEGKGYISDKPLIGLPEPELISRLFEKSLAKQDIHWPVTIEANSLDVIKQYVAMGFGAGIGIDIPHTKPFPKIRTIPLKNFPPVIIGAIYQGRLKPLAQLFLDAVKEKSTSLKNN